MSSACLEACSTAANWTVSCFDDCYTEEGWRPPIVPHYYNIAIALVLICVSAMFAGLTLGLMTLDKTTLQIIMESGDEKESRYARCIYPIRERGNLLLCTLLFGNTLVNAFVAILLADLTSGVVGLLASTFLILIFGEVIPQAVCSRYGLMIGANLLWLVRVFMVLFAPVTWPLAKVLDKALGREIGTVYSREELIKLIAIHVEDPDAQLESGLTIADHKLLKGALTYRQKLVRSVMTSLDKVFMLEVAQKLDFATLFEVYKSGFTRIPVYQGERHNIIGILYAKDLILVDPDDELSISAILSFHGSEIRWISEVTTLDEAFRVFKTSYIHMLFATEASTAEVCDEMVAPTYIPLEDRSNSTLSLSGKGKSKQNQPRITGLITLEDVLEELIQEEIVDETDNYVDTNMPVSRVWRARKRDVSVFLDMLNRNRHASDALSTAEMEAISTFLSSLQPFRPLAAYNGVIRGLVTTAALIDRMDLDEEEGRANGYVLYERGKPTDLFSLVLQGTVEVRAGEEEFVSEHGPWSVIGLRSLMPVASTTEVYVPDYTARTLGECRVMQISRRDYLQAVRVAQASYVSIRRNASGSLIEGAAPTGGANNSSSGNLLTAPGGADSNAPSARLSTTPPDVGSGRLDAPGTAEAISQHFGKPQGGPRPES